MKRGPNEYVLDLNRHLTSQEQHFNEIQSRYRTLASTWLLATFGAVGFLLTENLAFDVPRLALIGALACAGATGIYLCWVLDLLVYHRLLDAVFFEGIQLEREHRWLPGVRHNMLVLQHGTGVLSRVAWFYVVGCVVPLLIAAISAAADAGFPETRPGFVAGGVGLAAIGLLVWHMLAVTGNSADLITEIDAAERREKPARGAVTADSSLHRRPLPDRRARRR